MSVDLIIFLLIALVAIATAIGMLLSRNAVYSALFLVLNFGTVAVFYLFLSAPFISMSQITVYAGAIMVLFLFVIMLLGAEQLQPSKGLPWQRPVAIVLALVLVGEAAYLLLFRNAPVGQIAASDELFGSPHAIGELLFGRYLLPFEVTSIVLLVAMVAAIVLSRKEKGERG
jgi:NADH-quinone oxidoreductase subunit J